MNKIRYSYEKIRNEGFIVFLKVVAYFVRARVYTMFITTLKSKHTISIGDEDATFVSGNAESISNTIKRASSDEEIIQNILDNLGTEDVFYDVGANTGLYSCFAAKKCDKVIAFEPYPPNISELKRNANLNSGNISIFQVALSNKSDTVGFQLTTSSNEKKDAQAGFGEGAISVNNDYDIEVPAVKGDEFIKKEDIPRPQIVKVDVEGAEPLVVDGLKEILSHEKCRLVFCETHPPMPSSKKSQDYRVKKTEMIARFEELGYKVRNPNESRLLIAERI